MDDTQTMITPPNSPMNSPVCPGAPMKPMKLFDIHEDEIDNEDSTIGVIIVKDDDGEEVTSKYFEDKH